MFKFNKLSTAFALVGALSLIPAGAVFAGNHGHDDDDDDDDDKWRKKWGHYHRRF